MVIIILTTIVLTLLIPITIDLLSVEPAFTKDNLIQIILTSR